MGQMTCQQAVLALVLIGLFGGATGSALGGVLRESFPVEGPLTGQWRLDGPGRGDVADGAMRLHGTATAHPTVSLVEPVPNDTYDFRFDFRRDAEHFDGYAFTVCHSSPDGRPYWYVEFLGGAHRVASYCMRGGQWTYLGHADLTLDGKLDADTTWYRVEVHNEVNRFRCRVLARDTKDEIFSVESAHDAGPPSKLSFSAVGGDLAGLVDNVILAGPVVPSDPLPKAQTAGLRPVVSGGEIEMLAGAEAAVLLRAGESSAPFAQVSLSPEIIGEGPVPMAVDAALPTSDGELEQRWVAEAGRFTAVLRWQTARGPWLNVSLAAVNGEAQDKQVRLQLRMTPTDALGEATRRITFRKNWILESFPIDEPFDLIAPDLAAVFGTWAFSLTKQEVQRGSAPDKTTGVPIPTAGTSVDLYIPLACTYNERGGVVISCDPRSAFLFELSPRGVAASHIFFLKGEEAARDEGFFNGEVDVSYILRLGFARDPEWADLFQNHYRAANTWLSEGPRGPTGVFSGGCAAAPPSEASIARYKSFGTAYVGAGSMFAPESKLRQAMERGTVRMAQESGMQALLWTNIRMAPDTKKYNWHDPALDYRNFEDALLRNEDGDPIPCWDGFSCDPSPESSFAKFEIDRLTSWVMKYGLDGIFLDYYADTTDVIWTRTHQHLPFLPLQVGEIAFGKALSEWCQAHGKTLMLNCPHPSMAVAHLGHAICGDTRGPIGHMSMVERLMAAAAGKPHLLLTPIVGEMHSANWLQYAFGALIYGELPCPWVDRPADLTPEKAADWDVTDWMFARNRLIAALIADSQPMGGDTFTAMWYRHADDMAFIVLSNDTDRVSRRKVTLSRLLELPTGREYRAVLWDPVGAAIVLGDGNGSQIGDRALGAVLKPGETKIIAYVPHPVAAELLRAGN